MPRRELEAETAAAAPKPKRCEACGHRGPEVQFHFGMMQGDFCYPSCAAARAGKGL